MARESISNISYQINHYDKKYGSQELLRFKLDKEWRTMNNIIGFIRELKTLIKEEFR